MPGRPRFAPDRELFRQLVEQVPAVVFIDSHEPWWQTLYISPQSTEVLGDPPEVWLEDPGLGERRVHPDDHDRVMAEWRRVLATGELYDVEYRYMHPDGRILWLHERQRLVRDEAGAPRYWLGLIEDVTDVRSAADELRTSESRYRALVEQLPAVVYIDSDEEDPQSIYVSPNCGEVLGHSAASYIAARRKFRETMHPEDRERVFEAWSRSVRDGSPFSLEYRFVRPDGREVWVRDTARLVLDASGARAYWQGVILDVSAAKRFEQELQTSERRYRSLVEQLPAAIYEMGPDDERRTLFVSARVEEVLGYSRTEWLDQPDIWTELLHPDDREIELAAHDQQSATGEPWHREYRLIAADGRVVWVRDQAVLTVDEHGERTWQGVMLDITAQKEAEERLVEARDELEFRVLERTQELAEANELMALEVGERRRMEREVRGTHERYRRLVEHLPAVIYVWDATPDPRDPQSYVSPQIERVLGYTVAEWDTRMWIHRIHPHDRDLVIAASERSATTGEPYDVECRYLHKDGGIVWVWDRATLLTRDEEGAPRLFQGLMLDITARKEAEAKAQQAESRFHLLAEEGPAIAYTWEPASEDDAFVFLGARIEELLGYPRARWRSFDWFLSIVHPDDRDHMVATSLIVARTGEPWSMEYRVIAADGRIVWLRDEGRLLSRDEDGVPRLFQGVMLDVTERLETERRLEASEAASRALLEQMPAVPWTSTVDRVAGLERMTYIGPQSLEVLGFTPEELIEEPEHFARMLHPDDRERVLAVLRDGDRFRSSWQDEYRVVARDGTVRWLHAVGRAVTPPGATPQVWHGVTIDVTAIRAPRDRRRGAIDVAGDPGR